MQNGNRTPIYVYGIRLMKTTEVATEKEREHKNKRFFKCTRATPQLRSTRINFSFIVLL